MVNPVTGQPLKIDVLGFDACLMSMYEIGSVLAPYANYLLASELLEPGTGWDYSSLGYLVTGQLWSGEYVDPAKGHTEVELADLLISSFMVSAKAGVMLCYAVLWSASTSSQGSSGPARPQAWGQTTWRLLGRLRLCHAGTTACWGVEKPHMSSHPRCVGAVLILRRIHARPA